MLADINRFCDRIAERLAYLAGRWLDEREYEDFADYAAEMRKALPKGYTFVRATKRPFGFTFRADAFPGALYAVSCTTHSISWKRIA